MQFTSLQSVRRGRDSLVFCLLTLSMLAIAPGRPALAADDSAAVYGEIHALSDGIDRELRTGHDALQPLTDAMSGYFEFKQELSAQGFNYMIEISPQFQWDLDDGDYHGNNETNLIAQFSPFDPANPKSGTLMGWYQFANTLGSESTSEFNDNVGVISPLNGGDTGSNSSNKLWQMFAWEQWFANQRLRVGAGKLTTRTFLNLNRYAVSDREDFFTPVIVNNPVSPFSARNGMGVFGQYFFDEFYVTGMIREADGTSTDVSFDTLDSGKWEHALEFALTPKNLAGWGQGYYRFTFYRTDAFGEGGARSPSGNSYALSFDQDVHDDYGLLFRYAYANEDFRAFSERVVIGAQRKNPLGFKYDRIGLAGWWADPTDSSLSAEKGLEAFWKAQLAPFLEVSANLQWILNPQLDQDLDNAFVAGLRLRVVL